VAAAAAAEMAAPVVDAEYLRQVDRARRQLRALISNKGCAPIMLRLAYVAPPLPDSPRPLLALASACREEYAVSACLVGIWLGALVLSSVPRLLACWSCASLLILLPSEICAPGSWFRAAGSVHRLCWFGSGFGLGNLSNTLRAIPSSEEH